MSRLSRPIHLSPLQRSFAVALCVCLTSQFYFTVWAEGFRLSLSGVIYPVLLMTLKRESHHPDTGIMTGLCVTVFRTLGDLFTGGSFWHALMTETPGGIFYLCYDAIFCLMLKDRRLVNFRYIWFTMM